MNPANPKQPHSDQDQPVNDPTVDLSLDEFDAVDDLQALADQVADSTQELEPEAGGALDGTQKRVQELEKLLAEQEDRHHRLLADFANHRNRTSRDIQMAVTTAERKLLLELLPVFDSFERCIGSTYSSVEDFHNGVTLIHKQYTEALRKVGVEGVPLKVGDPFDAMHAEALTTTSMDNLPDGAVAAIYERGFMLRDQLLRPARVIVNHNETTASPSPDTDGIENPS